MTAPIPMVLHCPECRTRHVDAGEFATRAHHTHACQGCGFTWRPAVASTVGVQFLPGFKDASEAAPADDRVAEAIAFVRDLGSATTHGPLPAATVHALWSHAATLASAVSLVRSGITKQPPYGYRVYPGKSGWWNVALPSGKVHPGIYPSQEQAIGAAHMHDCEFGEPHHGNGSTADDLRAAIRAQLLVREAQPTPVAAGAHPPKRTP